MSFALAVSTLLPALGFFHGAFMALAPAKAGKKLFKFDEREIKPQVVELIMLNGSSALSLGVAETLLSFTNMDTLKVVSIATIPRVLFLIYSMVQNTKAGSEFLEPKNLMKIFLSTILMEGGFMDRKLSLQVRGGFYLFLGIVFTTTPNHIANRTSQFDANPATERCLRVKGKTDCVFGTLVYCLATMSYLQALGYASLAWFVTSLWCDFIIVTRDRFRSDAWAQLILALASTCILLTA